MRIEINFAQTSINGKKMNPKEFKSNHAVIAVGKRVGNEVKKAKNIESVVYVPRARRHSRILPVLRSMQMSES